MRRSSFALLALFALACQQMLGIPSDEGRRGADSDGGGSDGAGADSGGADSGGLDVAADDTADADADGADASDADADAGDADADGAAEAADADGAEGTDADGGDAGADADGAAADGADAAVGGRVLWFRADLGVALNGSHVIGWVDQSGTGDPNKTAAQGTQANEPLFVGSNAAYKNQPTVDFSGTEFLVTGNWAAALTQPFTVFVVGNTNSNTANSTFYDSNRASQIEVYDPIGSGVNVFAGNTLVSTATVYLTPSIVYVVYNGAASEIGVNRITPNVIGNAGTNGATGLKLGLSQYGGNLVGSMAELMVYNRVLSSAEIAIVTGYLAERYGLAEGP
jgi:hypothetical protein